MEPTRKATVVREMHSGLERIRHIVKKTFGRSKMQGVKLLTRELFVSDTGLALTSEVISFILKSLPCSSFIFNEAAAARRRSTDPRNNSNRQDHQERVAKEETKEVSGFPSAKELKRRK